MSVHIMCTTLYSSIAASVMSPTVDSVMSSGRYSMR